MPSRVQIEARSLAVFDAVKSGHRVEDGLVELKADWPNPQRSARRLAGHANSAHGEGILWLIGLDEAKGAQPLRDVELAEWWVQVQTFFDRVTPILTDVVVHTEDGPIHALFFDTSLSPFVLKNSAYGKPGGGPVEYEVPWRDGTAVRSATRSDLIRLLAPVVQLPELEALSASVVLRIGDPAMNEKYEWYFRLELYVTPQIGTVVVFPVHRTRLEFSLDGGAFNPLVPAVLGYHVPTRSTFESGLETSRTRRLSRPRVQRPSFICPVASTALAATQCPCTACETACRCDYGTPFVPHIARGRFSWRRSSPPMPPMKTEGSAGRLIPTPVEYRRENGPWVCATTSSHPIRLVLCFVQRQPAKTGGGPQSRMTGRAQVKISRVRIENYRVHRDTTVELKDLTAFIGRNGAGKSSILYAIGFFYDVAGTLTLDDIHAGSDAEAAVTVTYSGLSDAEIEAFGLYVRDGRLTVIKRASAGQPGRYYGVVPQIPEFAELRALSGAQKQIDGYRALRGG